MPVPTQPVELPDKIHVGPIIGPKENLTTVTDTLAGIVLRRKIDLPWIAGLAIAFSLGICPAEKSCNSHAGALQWRIHVAMPHRHYILLRKEIHDRPGGNCRRRGVGPRVAPESSGRGHVDLRRSPGPIVQPPPHARASRAPRA